MSNGIDVADLCDCLTARFDYLAGRGLSAEAIDNDSNVGSIAATRGRNGWHDLE
jgi:hypothetical protein